MQKTEETRFERPPLWNRPSLQWRRLVKKWFFLAWLAVLVCALYFYTRSTRFGLLLGQAQLKHHDIAALQTARVKDVDVQIGDRVTNGQIVAQLDTTLVDVQLAQAQATLAAAQDTLAAYEGQMHTLVRTFDDGISSAETQLQQQESQRQSDIARLAELRRIQLVRDNLFTNGLISDVVHDTLRPEIAGLEQVIAAYPSRMATYKQMLEDHRKEREELRQSLRLAPNEDIMKAIAAKTAAQTEILRSAVDMRKRERETFSLRAPEAGIVSDLTLLPGSVAQAGASILRIVSESRQIIGYLPEIRRGRLKGGDRGYAFRLGRPPVEVRVVAVAPEIDPSPTKINPASSPLGIRFPTQRVVFETDASSDKVAGEKVQIRMISEWSAKMRNLIGLR